jgi:hypothetical protein
LQEISFYTPRNLEEIRDEALKLQYSLKKCQENENRLVLKCQFLKKGLENHRKIAKRCLKFGKQDQDTLIVLTKELENAWNLFDRSFEREQLAIGVIRSLRAEIGNLTKLVQNLSNELAAIAKQT